MAKALDDGIRALYRDLREEAQNEIARLHGLLQTDQVAFGYRLLELARDVRAAYPAMMAFKGGENDNAKYLLDIVPELAVRLGVPRGALEPPEGQHPRLPEASGANFRVLAGMYFQLIDEMAFSVLGKRHFEPGERTERECQTGQTVAVAILFNNIVNGNPVAFAIDRIHPAAPEGQDKGDFIARRIRLISERRGHERTAEWHPGLLDNVPASRCHREAASVEEGRRDHDLLTTIRSRLPVYRG